MTDKEIMKMLKNAYALPETEKEKHFVRKYEKRSLQISDIIRTEFPYMKKRLPSLWTRGKFIATVGSVSLETVKQYIENQKGV